MANDDRWSEPRQRWRIMEEMEDDRARRHRWAMQSAGVVGEGADYRDRLDDQYEGGHKGRGPRGYRRSDARIAEEIHAALERDPRVDAGDVEVQVANGEVALSGAVDDRGMRHRIEDIVHDVTGVVLVNNSIRLRRNG